MPHYWLRLALLGALVLGGVAVMLAIPLLYRTIVDTLVRGATVEALVWPVLVTALAGLLGALLNFANSRFAADIAFRVVKCFQDTLLQYFSRAPLGFFTTTGPGVLVTRPSQDVYAVEPLYTSILLQALTHGLLLLGASVILLVIEPYLAVLLMLAPLVGCYDLQALSPHVPLRFARAVGGALSGSSGHGCRG